MMRWSAAPLALTLLCVSTAVDAAALQIGSRVRVRTTDSRTVTGTLTGLDTSGFTLKASGDASHVVAFQDMAGLEVSRRQRSQKVKWALIGAIPWIIVVTAVLADGGSDESGVISPQSALLLGGGVAGGLVIGSRKRTDAWERVPIPSGEGISNAGGFQVGIRLTF
jgi:hypothetical protein